GYVPGRDDQPARVRIAAERADHVRDLVDAATVARRPGTPLGAVDRPELAIRVGPLVPDGDAVLAQVGNVGLALEEPEELMHDRFQVQLLRGDEREAVGEVETHLPPEDRSRADARP